MRCIPLAACVLTLGLFLTPALAQTDTTFTYQGNLAETGNPANGTFDLDFELWDALTGGTLIGSPVSLVSVPVTQGQFSVELDFGAAAFDNSQRWIQIMVQGIVLNPRQPITRSPYSIQTRGIFVDDNSKVGIGTNSPQVAVHIAGSTGEGLPPSIVPGTLLLAQQNNGGNWAHMSILSGRTGTAQLNFGDADNDRQGGISYSNNTDSLGFVVNSAKRMSINSSGNVGIGTSTPNFRLHVVSNDTSFYARSTAPSGITSGVYGVNDSTAGTGVVGWATASTGFNYGLYGQSDSTAGRGVYGMATASTGLTYGGWFENASTGGRGVYGRALAFTGTTYGGRFESWSTSGTGVYGEAAANSDVSVTFGVYGLSRGNEGRGVQGVAAASSGFTYGVFGRTECTLGRGVAGEARATSGATHGVSGFSQSTSGTGVYGRAAALSGTTYGGQFQSQSTTGRAVYGEATATSGINYGGQFESQSTTGRGVFGLAGATSGVNYGVVGHTRSPNGFSFYASGAGTNYGSSSSRRWKSNIEPISDPLSKLAQLRGVYYDWDEEHGGQHDLGMIAEEVGKVLPEIVNYEDNGYDAIGMDYSKMTPLLVEAVNALRTEHDAEILALNDRIEQLENLVLQMASSEKE